MAAEGWSQTSFAELIAAGILQISDGYRAENAELGGDGPIFLRAGHVTDTHIDFAGVERFRPELADRVRSKMAQAGDVVVTTKGNSTGRVTFVTAEMPPFVYSPHLSYWRSLSPDRLCPGFLRYWSRGSEFTGQLLGLKASTDMAPYLSLIDQKRLKITLPPPEQQESIAATLGVLDDKIDLNRRMSGTLEAMARALFRSWFVDFDPVRAKQEGRQPPGIDAATAALFPDSFEDSPLGPIPAGWHIETVGKVIEGLYDGPHATPPDSAEGAVFLGIANVLDNRVDLTEVRRISEVDWPRWTRRITPSEGDIVFTYEATLGRFAMIPEWLRCCLGRRMALVRPKAGGMPPCFLYHHFTSRHFQELLAARTVSGATVDRISLLEFPSYPVIVPPSQLVTRLESVARPIWDRIHSNLQQNTTLADLRDALLPKLLSGEIRVKAAERLVETAT